MQNTSGGLASKDELLVQEITDSHVQGVLKKNMAILKTTGEISLFSAKKFKEAMNDRIENGVNIFLVDLSSTTHIDSSGLAAFISTQARLFKEAQGKIVIFSVPMHLQKIFELTKLDKLIGITIDLDAAIDRAMAS
ncbi:anti-sigma factor antagonist [Leptospira yasudae]|uniref:Anti-sigma factor antagonist n=1 Tax=Leptospira yasudae TaxID=2202201 RepID=A0ABX9M6D3_9LEPT|nr:STAS domain-containing protein [Leptospira yasudae]MBW0432662.1 STAS domain-containing protein [Leptospira yasudae]RHX81474.1 anti-sigma factor antagonist [Leptospira yasudae]RHX95987.1 anti-sigma factor antagonist [Leptospira yasudae]TGK29799.1 anti-sigma factor antagonist [Leptospira yasudae]TGM07576.1 anti-sigma factor antagonist [Leptospira yasudae]